MWRHLNKKGKNKVIYTKQTVVFSPPAWDEPKVRFWSKPPPPSSLINPLTSTLLLSLRVMTNCPPYQKKMLLPAEWCSSALSSRLFLIYLSFLSLLYENDRAPFLCWCCSDRKTHPPSASLSHSPSLTLIGCLLEVTSPFLFCLPPSLLLLCSLPSLSSPHSLWILAIPLLYPSVLPFLLPHGQD